MRLLFSTACILVTAGCLTSCLPDNREAKLKQQTQWEQETAKYMSEITRMMAEDKAYDLPANWHETLVRLEEERLTLEARYQEKEGELRQMNDELQALSNRLEEFKLTHPLDH